MSTELTDVVSGVNSSVVAEVGLPGAPPAATPAVSFQNSHLLAVIEVLLTNCSSQPSVLVPGKLHQKLYH